MSVQGYRGSLVMFIFSFVAKEEEGTNTRKEKDPLSSIQEEEGGKRKTDLAMTQYSRPGQARPELLLPSKKWPMEPIKFGGWTD